MNWIDKLNPNDKDDFKTTLADVLLPYKYLIDAKNTLTGLAEPIDLFKNDLKGYESYQKEIGHWFSSMTKAFDEDTLSKFENVVSHGRFTREDWRDSDLSPYLKINDEPILGSYQSGQEIVLSSQGIAELQSLAQVVLESKRENIVNSLVRVASSDQLTTGQRKSLAESLQDVDQKISFAQKGILELESPSMNISSGLTT